MRSYELRDTKTMRALSHPLRLLLFELVMREGTLTSTQASDLTGESTGTCSFHLRQLARYGFVEEAPGGKGRERPWRAATISFGWASVQEDASTAAAADALSELMLERRLRDLFTYLRGRANESDEWRNGVFTYTILSGLKNETADQNKDGKVTVTELKDFVSKEVERLTDGAQKPTSRRENLEFDFVIW